MDRLQSLEREIYATDLQVTRLKSENERFLQVYLSTVALCYFSTQPWLVKTDWGCGCKESKDLNLV